MTFLICEKIVFNPEDGSLTHCETQETVKLTLTASRLLERLLMSPQGLLSREQLLKEVWDDHGLQASNSSLNQYVSILRRTLSAFGCTELIITVPKMGFRINAELVIHRQETMVYKAVEMISASRSPMTLFKRMRVIAIFMLMITFCFVFISLKLIPSVSASHYPLYRDHLDTGCTLIFMKDLTTKGREEAKKHISAILKDNNVSCGPEKKLVFDSNDSFTSQSAGHTLFSLCTMGENQHIIACDNVYYHNWKNP